MSDLLQPLIERPDTSGILLDFDGTLSHIVPVPENARPVEGAAQLLSDLSTKYRAVALVSGRSAGQLLEWIGPRVDIWGVHGAERVVNGEVQLSPLVSDYEPLMRQVRDEAVALLESHDGTGITVEDKRVVIVLHYRAASDRATAAATAGALAENLTRRHGLIRVDGRAAVELRPPLELSKGQVVREIVRESSLERVLFAGDDRVDLGAFDALDYLEADGGRAVRVAVSSPEVPEELVSRADLVLDGPAGVMALLRALA